MSNLAVVRQVPAAAGHWGKAIFYRSTVQKGVYVLAGVPAELSEKAGFRLFVLGCRFAGAGCDRITRYHWYAFECSLEVAGYLAQVFPTTGREPLLVSEKNGRLLTGAAVQNAWKRGCKGVFVQRTIGSTSDLPRSQGEQMQLTV